MSLANTNSALPLRGRKLLIIVENLAVPLDRRVWQEATTLRDAGAQVVVICPVGKQFAARHEVIEDIHIYRHPLPIEAKGALGFLVEYTAALFHETRLAWWVFFRHGFDTLQACNPPDLIFLVAWPFQMLGRRFIFDHHDINPELYEAKFGRRGFFWRLLVLAEWLTFRSAGVVISTNESYRRIAIERGGKRPENVFVVRSGPDLSRVKQFEVDPVLLKGRTFLVGYVGIMGDQDGIDLLLRAAKSILGGRSDVQFLLIGDGPQRSTLEGLARELGIGKHVTFTGYLYGDALWRALGSIDVGVCPDPANDYNSRCTMNKVLEYMALGKPLVQFDLTEGRVSAQDAALYARDNDPDDLAAKIVELLDDPGLRSRMGENGRRRVEQDLSWAHEAPRLIAAYERAGE